MPSHCTALGRIPRRVSVSVGFTSIRAEHSGVNLAFAHLPSPSSQGSLHSQGQRLPGHLVSAAWLRLPVHGGILRPCLHLTSARTYPPAQAVPALVSRIFTWHLALHCVLGVFFVTAGPCFASAQRPGWK